MPDYILKFESKERGRIIEKQNEIKDYKKEEFTYNREKKFLIISSVNGNYLLNKNDTLVYHKNKFYFFNEKNKIVFEE